MERTLTVTCHLGMCNRLRVLLSGRVLAQVTQRSFAMLWSPTVGCGCTFDQLFENDWNVHSNLPLEQHIWLDGAGTPMHRFPDLLANGETELAVEANGWLFRPALYPAHKAIEQEARALTDALEPIEPIAQAIETFCAQNFRDIMIGVHLRRGDFLRWRPDTTGNLSATFQVVDDWLDAAPDAGILLCTDDGAPNPYKGRATPREETVAQFSKRYGERVLAPKTTTLDRREPKAIQEGLRDLWLLRRTQFFVGTEGSSFSDVAASGRNIPTRLTAQPIPQYARVTRWLERLRLARWLARWSNAQFGRELPYPLLVSHYLARIHLIRAHWTKQIRRAK